MRLQSVWTAFRSFLFCFLKVTLFLIPVVVLAAVVILSFAPNIARTGLANLGRLSAIGSAMLAPPLLMREETKKCVWMNQNWSDEDRAWVHNVSQGTATFPMPYAWFQRLERPELSPFARSFISDPAYLERLGFIAPNATCDPKPGSSAPEGYGVLPVGFAVLKAGTDPATGKEMEDGLGLTCAACHTGRVFYKGTELRIDGAPAMIDLGDLERVIGLSICYSNSNILFWRKSRLVNGLLESKKNLSADARELEKTRLENQIAEICEQKISKKVTNERDLLKRRGENHSEEGFGRLDALNRIGNQVFHENLLPLPHDDPTKANPAKDAADILALDRNFSAYTAPVSFPAIWDAPHFLWAQYDASILDPDIRNIGEALGVSARVNMLNSSDPSIPLFSSTVDFDAITKIEGLLRGPQSPLEGKLGFKGLHAPRWEDAASHFPDDDNWKVEPKEIVDAGRELYRAHCMECHLSPPRDAGIPFDDPLSIWNKKNWLPVGDQWLFKNTQKSVATMGTDPEQARVLTERTVKLPPQLGVDTGLLMDGCKMPRDAALEKSYALSLMDVVARVRAEGTRNSLPMTEAEKQARAQRNCPNPTVFRRAQFDEAARYDQAPITAPSFSYVAKPHYRARPLDGIWATAPYLHNGSVPTLDDLLLPQRDRPKAFCVGPMEFDPKRVGLTSSSSTATELTCAPGLTLFDVNQRGNSNLGHSFEGDGKLSILGRGLDAGEREKLIAYLKTL
jgi:hypothetical protein